MGDLVKGLAGVCIDNVHCPALINALSDLFKTGLSGLNSKYWNGVILPEACNDVASNNMRSRQFALFRTIVAYI